MARIKGNSKKNSLKGTQRNDTLHGFSGNDRLMGQKGNDVLDGGTGKDILSGGLGNDTYIVDHLGDRSIELANQGTDKVQSSVTYKLGNHVEHLVLTGNKSIRGTGNALNNYLAGNAGDNLLSGLAGKDNLRGGAGNDILDGGVDQDVLLGGVGDDIYVVDNIKDKVVEGANQGIDSVRSSISYGLGNHVENLVLTGTQNLDGKGNNLVNTITGNSGHNVLNGDVGADTLIGGMGDDTYLVDNIADTTIELANGGIDRVRTALANYKLADNVEYLEFTGTQNSNGTGNGSVNTIIGNVGNNILDGAAGIDKLIGGLGDDIYIVSDIGDLVVEAVGEGVDLVKSSLADYTLTAQVENLLLVGNAIKGTGNDLVNTITGNAADNVLDGAAGADKLIGGLGSDTYLIDNAGDLVVELVNEGIDVVRSTLTDYTLTEQVENLELLTGAINGTGNDLANTIIGNAANNILSGGAGADSLVGGAGADKLIGGLGIDTLTGGAGIDTFALLDMSKDIITDFNAGEDIIALGQTAFGLVDQVVGSVLSADRLVVVNSDASALEGASGLISNLLVGATRLIYSTESGKLFYDANGTNVLGVANGLGSEGGLIATLDKALGTAPTLTNASFVISSIV
jgi:Ca2+-binding RTX toxin-like protein